MEFTYTKRQEAVLKDIERCFGVVQGRFQCMRVERKQWTDTQIIEEGQACVVLHNMILSMAKNGMLDEHDEFGQRMTSDQVVNEIFHVASEEELQFPGSTSNSSLFNSNELDVKYCSKVEFERLRKNLCQEIWNQIGSENG
jgi:Plant transposon protein